MKTPKTWILALRRAMVRLADDDSLTCGERAMAVANVLKKHTRRLYVTGADGKSRTPISAKGIKRLLEAEII